MNEYIPDISIEIGGNYPIFMRAIKKLLRLLFIAVFILGAIRLISFYSFYIPKIEKIPQNIQKHLEQNGSTYITIDDIPPHFIEALIATEDRRFYSHHGMDIRGLLRAVYVNILNERFAQGGSTITQQVARMQFLSRRKSIERKIKELLIAITIERIYTKDEILEMYINQTYFGHGAHGIRLAASLYLHKPIQLIDLAEAAFIAGLPRGPAIYDPFINEDLAKDRQGEVLDNMVEVGYIDEDAALQAYKEYIPCLGDGRRELP